MTVLNVGLCLIDIGRFFSIYHAHSLNGICMDIYLSKVMKLIRFAKYFWSCKALRWRKSVVEHVFDWHILKFAPYSF
jgi:hypothetical protein